MYQQTSKSHALDRMDYSRFVGQWRVHSIIHTICTSLYLSLCLCVCLSLVQWQDVEYDPFCQILTWMTSIFQFWCIFPGASPSEMPYTASMVAQVRCVIHRSTRSQGRCWLYVINTNWPTCRFLFPPSMRGMSLRTSCNYWTTIQITRSLSGARLTGWFVCMNVLMYLIISVTRDLLIRWVGGLARFLKPGCTSTPKWQDGALRLAYTCSPSLSGLVGTASSTAQRSTISFHR